MTSYVSILTFITLCAYCACGSPLICSILCAHKSEFPGLKVNQDCICGETGDDNRGWLKDVQERGANRRNSTSWSGTTLAPTTTTDICDYLCSIQLGGEACQCSSPGLPGRKKK